MNFDFSDDQKLLRDQARKFLTDKCDRTVVRSILEDNKKNHSEKLKKELDKELSQLGSILLYRL